MKSLPARFAVAVVFALSFLTLEVKQSTADLMYVVHGGFNAGAPFGGELGIINQNNFQYTSLGQPVANASLTGLAAIGNRLYASTSNHSLAVMNLSGGLISESAFFGGGFDPSQGYRVNDLAVSPTGQIYAAVGINGPSLLELHRVNQNTGELTRVGSLPFNGGGFHSLAFSDAGDLFAHQTNAPGVFDEIDPNTGLSINALPGGVPGGALGLGFNNGLLYASECCAGSDGSSGERLFTIDPVTGNAVMLFDFNDGRRIQDIAFAIPEPGAGIVLLFGGFAIAFRRQRRV